jgi:ribokinase
MGLEAVQLPPVLMTPSPKIVVLGSLNIDLIFPLQRLPLPGETLPGGDLILAPGGKGANQACAAGKLGARTIMAGQLGRDAFAAVLRKSLLDAGVDTAGVTEDDCATGAAGIFVMASGENSIVLSAGANGRLTPDRVAARLESLTAGDYLLLQLEIPLESTLEALRIARNRGAIAILDPAPARPLPPSLYPMVDWLTPNQTEAAALLEDPTADISTYAQAEAVAERLLARGPRGVVVKLGAMGCLVATGEQRIAVPARAVQAVDTTAAGDAFNAAFAVGLAEGMDPAAAARFGCAAATISVTRLGAQTSLPDRAEVEQFLKES